MKIYFAGSIRGGREEEETYLKLIEHLATYGQVLTEHVGKKGIDISEEEIESYIVKRNQARDQKDFDLSDKIRDELLEKGIILEDKESGTTWKKS